MFNYFLSKLKKITLSFRFTGVAFLLIISLISGVVYAANYGSWGYKVTNTSQHLALNNNIVTQNIEEWGICKVARNDTGVGSGVFIPTKSAPEWASVHSPNGYSLPQGLSLLNCTQNSCTSEYGGNATVPGIDRENRDVAKSYAISNGQSQGTPNSSGGIDGPFYYGIQSYMGNDQTLINYLYNNFSVSSSRWENSFGSKSGTDTIGNLIISWETYIENPMSGAGGAATPGWNAEINLSVYNTDCGGNPSIPCFGYGVSSDPHPVNQQANLPAAVNAAINDSGLGSGSAPGTIIRNDILNYAGTHNGYLSQTNQAVHYSSVTSNNWNFEVWGFWNSEQDNPAYPSGPTTLVDYYVYITNNECQGGDTGTPPPPVTTHTVTITNFDDGGTGTISGSGLNCGVNCTKTSVPDGATISLTAYPDSGSTFEAWAGGGCSGTHRTCSTIIHSDVNITGIFGSPGGGGGGGGDENGGGGPPPAGM